MGHQGRLKDRKLSFLEEQVQALGSKLRAVAESAGSALAVEALCELVGREKVGEMMRVLMKRKQDEAEAQMAARVSAEVEAGRLVPAETVGERSLVVGVREEGAAKYRVDLVTPVLDRQECALYLGKRAGDVVEQGGSKTTIGEIYEAGEGKTAPEPEPETAATAAEEAVP